MHNKSSRVLVNLIGVPLILTFIYLGDRLSNIPFFSIFIVIVLFLGAMEIPIFIKSKGGKPSLVLLLLFLAILQIDRYHLINWDIPIYVLVIGIVFFSMFLELFRKQKTPLLNISILLFAFVWLGIMLGSLSALRNLDNIGYRITLALFLSVWICDTFAFLFGKKFGEKKIIPNISPNKTWIGTMAGMLSSIIFMLILNHYDFFNGMLVTVDVLIVGIISGVFGQFGDWTESLLKREANLKDTSNILRGHGGVLDRFDSLTFAAPLTYIYCNYIIKIG